MMPFFLFIALAYLVGAIPTGYIWSRYCCETDITKRGSGNIGATNVARVLGKKWYFFLILFIDAAKAYGCLWFASLYSVWLIPIAVALLIGNGYSIFLNFRGGKGVSTAIGIIAFLHPILFIIMLILWVLVYVLARRVALASLVAPLALVPVYIAVATSVDSGILIFLCFLAAWIIFRHSSNIRELWGNS